MNYILLSSSGAGGGNFTTMIIIYAVILGGMYLLFIRPQSKKKKQEEALRKNVDVGDEITTIGGIMGRVISIKEETESVVIETGTDKTRIRIKKWAIGANNTVKEKNDAEQADSGKQSFLGRLLGGGKKATESSEK
ncbi:MAG: preprotein translocase subunit YajC [Oscillospiraceae bacterium]|jgi:preprotein translocase subunit YajC|nr:preprotein translocase subunit YajC [Oscillospiraceae bacterium]